MMRSSTPNREESERRVRACVAAGDVGSGVTGVLRLYGAEVFGFVAALIETPAIARDVYATVGEQMACSLAGFEWRCDLRTWMYLLARRELAAFRERNGAPAEIPSGPQKPPSSSPFRQKAFRDVLSTLRRRLPVQDREILILRVDRRLSWRSLAITGLGDRATDAELAREEARLRDRLERIKEKLGQIARDHGILVAR